MSEQGGQQDPAERLAAALRRIAVAVERREAAGERPGPPSMAPASMAPASLAPTSLAPVAGDLDALIGRLRSVLDDVSHGSS